MILLNILILKIVFLIATSGIKILNNTEYHNPYKRNHENSHLSCWNKC
jgi:hypothetical protein